MSKPQLTFKETITKARDHGYKIESRSEMAIGILEKIAFKQKPTSEDMREIRRAIVVLKDIK